MTTNAGTWFYETPEQQPYLISERLNGTFWGARVKNYYWKCLKADAPCQAEGYGQDGTVIGLEWQPGQWLAATIPAGVEADPIIDIIKGRILARPPSLTFGNADGGQVYEWHIDGGQQRWQQIQGTPRYVKPHRLGS